MVLYALGLHSFGWSDIPIGVKTVADMRFRYANAVAYTAYSLDPAGDAMVVVRPHGYVGTIAHLHDCGKIEGHSQNAG